MSQAEYEISSNKINFLIDFLKKDIVFTISLILALSSCFLSLPKTSYIDFKVLSSLFCLMVVVKAFEDLNLLDYIAVYILNKCTNIRRVSLVLIILSFFMSMFVTNDISLITLVPLSLIISKKSSIDLMYTIILQTIAANIGSSLTPMGNPQNLYIFSYYNLTAKEFFSTILLIAISGLLLLYVLSKRNRDEKIDISLKGTKIKSNSLALLWISLFIIVVLSVFGILDYKITFFLIIIAALILNSKLLFLIDYPLLITFVCFFIFIGNVSNMPLINSYMKNHLNSSTSVYFTSIVLSQFISNVPACIFLSKFTDFYRHLLLGVNVGGLGTLIASLASIISYKLYLREYPQKSKDYIVKFTLNNLLALIILTVIGAVFLI
ncbi:transporter, YbiR family [Caloramator quimbayensis]|uniref:Transporter, YbiR family n=1 Tax=Caloramator quimbayensis TaxID=1147123 RepID=A0A1T4XEE7_9CLOT|nr:SLC13 family permease [Caloramator quimbayensis]SKA87926.1 transporter, YbiR family [Caloramator quimbayensis]